MSKNKGTKNKFGAEPSRPRVYIQEGAAKKLQAYFALADGEISGFGCAEVRGADFYITDVFLVEQEAGVAHVDFKEEHIHNFVHELIVGGQEDKIENLKLWWHSHGRLTVGFSTTDQGTVNNWPNPGWLLSIVGNKYGDWYAQVDTWDPFRVTVPSLEVIELYNQEDWDSLREEVRKKVKKPTYSYSSSKTSGGKKATKGYGTSTVTPLSPLDDDEPSVKEIMAMSDDEWVKFLDDLNEDSEF